MFINKCYCFYFYQAFSGVVKRVECQKLSLKILEACQQVGVPSSTILLNKNTKDVFYRVSFNLKKKYRSYSL